jgi:hypothetical protein
VGISHSRLLNASFTSDKSFWIRIRRYEIPAGKILYGFVIPTGLLLRNVSSSALLRFVFTVFQKLVEFSHQVQQFCSVRFFTCLLSKAFPSRFMCVTGHKKVTPFPRRSTKKYGNCSVGY